MAHLSTPALRPTPRINHWPVRAISVLLIVQAVGLASITIYFLRSINWADEATYVIFSVHAQDTAIFTVIFSVIAVATLLTAAALYLHWSGAWLLAMGVQGFILSYCLGIYFLTNAYLRASIFLYLIMLYSIILVLYLNTTDVRQALFSREASPDTWGNADFHRSEPPDPQPPVELTDERQGD